MNWFGKLEKWVEKFHRKIRKLNLSMALCPPSLLHFSSSLARSLIELFLIKYLGEREEKNWKWWRRWKHWKIFHGIKQRNIIYLKKIISNSASGIYIFSAVFFETWEYRREFFGDRRRCGKTGRWFGCGNCWNFRLGNELDVRKLSGIHWGEGRVGKHCILED
jgi:hypothetical protein